MIYDPYYTPVLTVLTILTYCPVLPNAAQSCPVSHFRSHITASLMHVPFAAYYPYFCFSLALLLTYHNDYTQQLLTYVLTFSFSISLPRHSILLFRPFTPPCCRRWRRPIFEAGGAREGAWRGQLYLQGPAPDSS